MAHIFVSWVFRPRTNCHSLAMTAGVAIFPLFSRQILMTGLITTALSFWATFAQSDTPVFYSSQGTAISGYDVVTYFRSDTPKPGTRDHAVMWKGATWQFVSAENREAFEANPRAFAPQYGGYCAYGVSQGYIVSTDPTAWRIHEGKLYLTHSPAVWVMWKRDIADHVVRANANWPGVLAQE